MKKLSLILAAVLAATSIFAAVPTPPTPVAYFNDYAHVVSTQKAAQLDAQLREFEKQTTNQVVVAIWPTSPEGVDLDRYMVDTARAWRVGQKDKNNGAVIFVFVKRSDTGKTKFEIEVGYGLEGVITDAMAKRIFEQDFKPHCVAAKNGGGTPEWDKALDSSVQSTLLAAKGEYKAPEVATASVGDYSVWFWIIAIIVVLIIIAIAAAALSGSTGGGYGTYGGYSGSSYGGYSSGGDSSSSGGFSGFSGGGGSFGGGGGGGDC